MQKKNLNRLLLLSAVALVVATSSCKKEELQPPATENETGATLIFIRAVDKDSTFINSVQIPLR